MRVLRSRLARAWWIGLIAGALVMHSTESPARDLSEAKTETELIGAPAQPWHVSDWINSDPKELEDLRGRVVLVRWWTAPGCPYCRNSAPALNQFYNRYKDQGLSVIGFYHHKSRGKPDLAEVTRQGRRLGFAFPIAIDHDWRTLRRWWLDRNDRNWTSVTFLLDHKGVIRHIHPGGQYIEGDDAHGTLQRAIEELLAEMKNGSGAAGEH